MSSGRQAVDWGFGKIAGLFAFVDFREKKTKYFPPECCKDVQSECIAGKLPYLPVWCTGLTILRSATTILGSLLECPLTLGTGFNVALGNPFAY